MRAFITDFQGPSGLKLIKREPPKPGPGQLRVKVNATALNRADLLQTLGLYPAPAGVPADIPGLEYAGEVAELGVGASRFQVGDRVMGIIGGGGWAEELVVAEREAIRVPKNVELAQAAAIPEAFITAWDALFLQGGLKLGQWALIHAVGSGVGTAAVQLVSWAKAHSVGTARSPDKLEKAKALGLEVAIHVSSPPEFADQVKQASGGGAQVVLDLVGGEYFPETLEATAPRGTVMLVGLTAGASAEVPLRTILSKRLQVRGTTLRARSAEEKAEVAVAFGDRVLAGFESGALKPVVGATRPFDELPQALEAMAKNETFGKVVLTT